jgi:hypothetical protein
VQAFTQPILGALRSLGRDQDLLMDRHAFVLEHAARGELAAGLSVVPLAG